MRSLCRHIINCFSDPLSSLSLRIFMRIIIAKIHLIHKPQWVYHPSLVMKNLLVPVSFF